MNMPALRAAWSALPYAPLDTILSGHRPLILAPHPDDESLGCGGLIATACAAGRPPHVVILTDGAASHPGSPSYPPARLRDLRESEAHTATAILGLPESNLHFLRFPDTALPNTPQAAARITALAHATHTTLLIAPWPGDPHGDHETAAHLAARIGLPCLHYPVWGWLRETSFSAPPPTGWRLDITPHLAAKRRAIAAHASQYTNLIPDSPAAFRLPANLLAIFEQPFEVYLT